jgi:hypothetical protein
MIDWLAGSTRMPNLVLAFLLAWNVAYLLIYGPGLVAEILDPKAGRETRP